MRRIATEEAFVTPRIRQGWTDVLDSGQAEPGFIKMGESILGGSPGALKVRERLLDLGPGRIRQMDADGISVQVVSVGSPGVQVFEPDLAAGLAAEANDILAQACAAYPDRLVGLATVPPNNPAFSARELERAKSKLDMRGLIINSHTEGRYLDEPFFEPVLEAAAALDMPLYLHPREPGPAMAAPFLDYGLYFAGWGFAAECGLHAMRLIMSGAFDRYPKLKIVLGHLGEGIPFWLDRIDNRYLLQVKIGAVERLQRLPSDYFRENFYITTSGMNYDAPLRLCLEMMPLDHVLFAADYPFEDAKEAADLLDAATITGEQREAIYSRNPARVFGID